MAIAGEWQGFYRERDLAGRERTIGITIHLHSYGTMLRGAILENSSYSLSVRDFVNANPTAEYLEFLRELDAKDPKAVIKVEHGPKADVQGVITGTKFEFLKVGRGCHKQTVESRGDIWTLCEIPQYTVKFVGALLGHDLIKGNWLHEDTSTGGLFQLTRQ